MAEREPDSKPLVTTPVAIVLAGGLIALALFFGLRSRDEQPSPPPPPPAPPTLALTTSQTVVASAAPPAANTATAGAANSTPSAVPTPPGSVDPTKVASQVSALLEKQRKTITDKCVTPLQRAGEPAAPIKITLDLTFNAEGKQLARGILEDRANKRPGIGNCVQDTLPSLDIGPQPASVSLQVPWTLP